MKLTAKKIAIIVLSLCFLFGIKQGLKTFRNTDTLLGRISALVNRDNSIKLSSKTLDLDQFSIVWKPELATQKIIYANGEKADKIGYEYGKNTFVIMKDEKEMAQANHFKTNNWHSHDYHFNIEQIENAYVFRFEASGPNEFVSLDTISIDTLKLD